MTIGPSIPAHRSGLIKALANSSELQIRKRNMVYSPIQSDWWKPPKLTNTLVISSGRLSRAVCLQWHDTLAPGDRAGQGRLWNLHNSLPSPTPAKLCHQALSLGPLGSDCLLPGARETLFCLLSLPDCPLFVLPPRWGWQVTEAVLKWIFLLPPLPLPAPSNCKKILASFHHLGLVLEI